MSGKLPLLRPLLRHTRWRLFLIPSFQLILPRCECGFFVCSWASVNNFLPEISLRSRKNDKNGSFSISPIVSPITAGKRNRFSVILVFCNSVLKKYQRFRHELCTGYILVVSCRIFELFFIVDYSFVIILRSGYGLDLFFLLKNARKFGTTPVEF